MTSKPSCSHRCHSGKDVARQQPQRELVRVLKNRRVMSWQIERGRDRNRRVDGAGDVVWFHPRILASGGAAEGRNTRGTPNSKPATAESDTGPTMLSS